MKTITRYGLGREYAGNTGSPAITEQADGAYVSHADHLALINELQAELVGVERIAAAQTVTIAELRANHSEIPNSSIGAQPAASVDSFAEVVGSGMVFWRYGKPPDGTKLYTSPVVAQPDPAMAPQDWIDRMAHMMVDLCMDDDAAAEIMAHARKRVQPASGEDSKP